MHGSMAYRRLANRVIKNIQSTNSNEKRFEIGNSNMKNIVKKSLFTMPQRGKHALISEELSTEIKQILSNL